VLGNACLVRSHFPDTCARACGEVSANVESKCETQEQFNECLRTRCLSCRETCTDVHNRNSPQDKAYAAVVQPIMRREQLYVLRVKHHIMVVGHGRAAGRAQQRVRTNGFRNSLQSSQKEDQQQQAQHNSSLRSQFLQKK
jgi:hypothetical protein